MPTVNLQVGVGTNDARWILGAFYDESAVATHIGNNGGSRNGIIARFTGVTIPQGAVISSASFSVYSFASNSPPASIIGKCADADNASMPGSQSAAGSAAKTSGTSSTVSWSGNGFQSVDVTSEIQSVVNRAGWASGNAIVVYLYDNGSASGKYMYCGTYNDLPSEAPKLSVTYSTAAPSLVSREMPRGQRRGIARGIAL